MTRHFRGNNAEAGVWSNAVFHLFRLAVTGDGFLELHGLGRRLAVVLFVAAVHRVALADNFGQHRSAIGVDPDALAAPAAVVVPAGGQRHDHLVVGMVLTVALRRSGAVPAFREVVDGHVCIPLRALVFVAFATSAGQVPAVAARLDVAKNSS
ncbi:hypothetical protein B296_00010195 [Ensete ventricosum]|uniref:Uncharacterized protein n=1 Tax=Ensete ventricosum TaxID=4639 RepID=A0A426Z916_ENSVE|nr:hypothetical protein B296_00010195 [Ensete ventricosum]